MKHFHPDTATATPAFTQDLADVIRRYGVNKAELPRDPASEYGGYLPRTHGVSIVAGGSEYFDADVRRVDDAGVRVMVGTFQDDLPWSKIRAVSVLAMGRDGRWNEGPRITAKPERKAA